MTKKKSGGGARRTFRDLFKKRASPAQVTLSKEPRSRLRFVSPAERAANPDKFSPKGSYLVRKGVRQLARAKTSLSPRLLSH